MRKVIFFKKANKDNNLPGSFRPISILECLFKVINRCVINRLDNLSNEIFNKNQYGFIRSRSGASATRTIQTIQQAQSRSNENYSIIFLDNKQAFDRISQDAIIILLEKMGFPSIFIKWIKHILKNGKAFTEINGVISEIFCILTGTPQGSPSSSTLYIVAQNFLQLCYELRKLKFKAKIHNIEIPLICFADDSFTVAKFESRNDIEEFFAFFKEFEKIIGLTLNKSKTEILVYGPLKDKIKSWFDELKFGTCVNEAKHLGININHDFTKTAGSTVQKISEKIQVSINFLIKTKADMFRRKTLLNLGIHSKLNHAFQSCTIKKSQLNAIWKKIIKALWAKDFYNISSRGRSLIARDRLPASYTKGGLQLTDTYQKYKRLSIEASYKILKNYFFQQNDLLSKILDKLLPPSLRYDGSKGIHKCIRNLHKDISFLKPALLFLEKQVFDLENNKDFMTGSSIHSSLHILLSNRPTRKIKEFLEQQNINTIGHMITFYNENKHTINPTILRDFESFMLPLKVKIGEFRSYMSVPHINMILHGFPKIKQLRPKFLIKKEYEDCLDEKFQEPPALKTRNKDKTLNISKEQYAFAYKFSTHLPLSSYYKTFCFNILNRTLYTASKGFQMNIEASRNCKKCLDVEEDTVHLLLDCDNLSYLIWNELDKGVNKLTDGKCNINWQIILFHIKPKHMQHSLFKQIIIFLQLLKADIYRRRNDDQCMPNPMKIRAIIIVALRKTIRILKLRSQYIFDLENLCAIMEDRMVNNVFNDVFNRTNRRWIMD